MALLRWVSGTSVVIFVACTGGVGIAFDGALPVGTWGGDGAGMIVSDTSMHLHVGCTFGDVSGRVSVASGTFEVDGSYMLRLPSGQPCRRISSGKSLGASRR